MLRQEENNPLSPLPLMNLGHKGKPAGRGVAVYFVWGTGARTKLSSHFRCCVHQPHASHPNWMEGCPSTSMALHLLMRPG